MSPRCNCLAKLWCPFPVPNFFGGQPSCWCFQHQIVGSRRWPHRLHRPHPSFVISLNAGVEGWRLPTGPRWTPPADPFGRSLDFRKKGAKFESVAHRIRGTGFFTYQFTVRIKDLWCLCIGMYVIPMDPSWVGDLVGKRVPEFFGVVFGEVSGSKQL